MKFGILLAGFGLFFSCLVVHIIFWRLRHPRHHALALVSIFFIPAVAILSTLLFTCPKLQRIDLFAIGLLHAAVSCAYIQLYPASQASSPSMKILRTIHKSMPRGMAAVEIQSVFDPVQVFDARVEDLYHSGLLSKKDSEVTITARGRAFIVPFIFYRKLLGIPPGNG